MPKFYMHIHDGGEVIKDFEGQTYSNVEMARSEAEASAREMLAEKVRLGEEIDGQEIEIVDQNGTVVGTVRFADQLNLRHEFAAD